MLKYIGKAIGTVALVAMLAGCSRGLGSKKDVELKEPVVKPLLINQTNNGDDKAKGAKKRKFDDFTGDGIEDMMEVRDTVVVGQDYKGYVFPGVNNEGYLQFSQEGRFVMDIPTKMSWFSAQTKIDAADTGGDKLADVIFSEYRVRIGRNTFNAKIALNQGDGTFKYAKSKIPGKMPFNIAFERILSSLMDDHNTTEDIDDYLIQDWADWNGDGRDDFMAMWKTSMGHLDIRIAYSAPVSDPKSEVAFEPGIQRVYLKKFMRRRSISDVDTEDFTGDGITDIVVYHRRGRWAKLRAGFAKGSFENGKYGLEPQPDEVKDVPSYNAMALRFALKKFDSYDSTFDGKADINFIHKSKGKPQVAVYETKK